MYDFHIFTLSVLFLIIKNFKEKKKLVEHDKNRMLTAIGLAEQG